MRYAFDPYKNDEVGVSSLWFYLFIIVISIYVYILILSLISAEHFVQGSLEPVLLQFKWFLCFSVCSLSVWSS
jgi:hypothetical protein